MKYFLLYLPDTTNKKEYKVGPFDSPEEAWDNLPICELCEIELAQGYEESEYIDENGKKFVERREITHRIQTACSAEWMLVDENGNNINATLDI